VGRYSHKFSNESVVAIAGHIKVDVVVPWNVAPMANGAQECATGEEISDSSFQAELMHRVENVDLQLA
jgi:hypothetical protein